MQYASAIYWGGDLIAAPECDYDTYRDKGTICPYCGSAVHLRASSTRTIAGKPVLVNAYFAHYKSGSDADWCEARSTSPHSAADRQQLQIAAKNQRLKLFNDRLWDMIQADRNIDRGLPKRVKNLIGGDAVVKLLPSIRAAIAKTKAANHRYFVKMMGAAVAPTEATTKRVIAAIAQSTGQSEKESAADMAAQSSYFRGCNQRLHIQVCDEVMDFLATRSGGYCLERILLSSLPVLLEGNTANWPKLSSNPKLPEIFVEVVIATVSGTHWGDAIGKYSASISKNNA